MKRPIFLRSLKPCPCCGAPARLDRLDDWASVQCYNKRCCLIVSRQARPGRSLRQAELECIEVWNLRDPNHYANGQKSIAPFKRALSRQMRLGLPIQTLARFFR
jgi:hypothetical protein